MNIIVAVYNDWGIGYNGTQTIVIPEDRRHFKEITYGGVVIAGRKTFEDIRAPLPGRKNIILTRDRHFKIPGAVIAHSIDETLALIADEDPDRVFVIGGGSVYKMFLPLCAYAFVTKIGASPLSDTFFPDLDALPEWRPESSETGTRDHLAASRRLSGEGNEYGFDAGTGVRYSFCLYRNEKTIRS